jgi:hypothetical protein
MLKGRGLSCRLFHLAALEHFDKPAPVSSFAFPWTALLWHTYPMGNKDKGRKEVKKAPKPKPKALPQRREGFTPPPAK